MDYRAKNNSGTVLSGKDRRCEVGVRRVGPTVMILDISGWLGASGRSSLELSLHDAVGASCHVLLNLSGLDHMDPDGAGALIIAAARMKRHKLRLAASGLTEGLADVFHLTRLDEAIVLFPSESDVPAPSDPSQWPQPCALSTSLLTGPSLAGWAPYTEALAPREIPGEAMNINVRGRKTTSPVTGFGPLWDKCYRLRAGQSTVAPGEILATWKAEFPDFWPSGNRFYPSGNRPIEPGTEALLNLALPGGMVLATGLRVIYADDACFSFMTIQGHILAGWITFRCFVDQSDVIIEINPLFRSADPLMDAGFRLGAASQEDSFWHDTLENLARRLELEGEVSQEDVLIDQGVNWRRASNLWYSAAIRSAFYMPWHLVKSFRLRPRN